MKLPGINYNTPVQSLGREDISLPARNAAVNTSIADMAISSLAQFANNKIKKTFDFDTEDANNAYTTARSQAMDAKQRLLSMQSYSPDELNEGIQYRATEKGVSKEDGSEIEITRKSISASEVNPQLFEQTMKNIRSQGAENLSPQAAGMFDKQFDKLYMNYRETVMADNRTKSVKDRETQVIMASMKLAKSGDFAGAAMNINASNLPQAIKMLQIAKLDLLAEDTQILSSISNEDIMMMEYNLNRLKDDNYEGPYSPLKREQGIRDLEQGIKSAFSEAEEMMTRQTAKQYGNLVVAADRGQTTYTEIENAWDNEVIKSPAQYAAIIGKLDRFNENKSKEIKGLIDVNKILATDDMWFSPTNSDQKKAVNAFYAANPTKEVAIDLAKKGILPKQVKDIFSMFNRGGTTKQVTEVSRFYADMVRLAPKTLRDIPERHRNDMGNMAEMINAGVKAEDAVKILDKWENRGEAEQKYINKTYSKEVLGSSPQRKFYEKQFVELRDKLNGDDKYDKTLWGMGGAPVPSTAMVNEYDMLKRRYFQSSNDMGKASNRAYETLSTTWAYSEINGSPQIVKYGVEEEYNMPTKAVRSQLKSEMKAIGITQEVKLVNTSDTPTNKVYQVSDENGFPLFKSDGTPINQWYPNYDAYAKAKEADEDKKKAERKAKAAKENELAQYEKRRSRLTKETNFKKAAGFYSERKSIYDWESANDKRNK